MKQDFLQSVIQITPLWVPLVAVLLAAWHGFVWMIKYQVEKATGPLLIRIEKTDDKLNTIWTMLWRRAESLPVINGMATMNSPITFHAQYKEWLASMAPDLQAAFRARWSAIEDDGDLALEIEKEFGERLVKEICIPHGIHNLECLALACAVAREAAPE